MMTRVRAIAANTFRESVRDRVLYNLVFFVLLLVASAPLFGQISAGIQRILLVNLSLSAISIFGIVISVFLGISLVSKEIEKRTLYPVLARPISRAEFVVGKFFGLSGTLIVNTVAMALGFYIALFLMFGGFTRADWNILIAIYFILLQFFVIIGLALLFSSFSSPLLSALFALSMFVVGTFAGDLRGYAQTARGPEKWVAVAAGYVVPNLASLNVITRVSHDQPVPGALIGYNSLYALLYTIVVVSGAVLIFSRRNLK